MRWPGARPINGVTPWQRLSGGACGHLVERIQSLSLPSSWQPFPFNSYVKEKTPGSFLPGVLLSVSSLSGSEVTLSANVQVHSALVLVLIDRSRLGSHA